MVDLEGRRIDDAVRSVGLYLLDMDGTLYLGDEIFPFTIPFLDSLKRHGRKYLFMTNNSSKSVDSYIEKLARLGIGAGRDEFMTSSQATEYYLNLHHKYDKIYVMGTESLKEEFRQTGLDVTDVYDEDVTCIVSGYDTELNYQKLDDVSRLLTLKPDLPYIATNPDLVCPTEYGYVPDCGSVSDMIFNATGRRPVFIGKPSPLMEQLAMKKLGFTPERTAVIGDRIYTDIKSGLNAGITAFLVMSGETTREILDASPDKPTFVLKDISAITSVLEGM